GAVGRGSMVRRAAPGTMREALRMLFNPAAPLRIPVSYLPKAAPWLTRFVGASQPDEVRRISDVLATLLGHSIERQIEILREIGAPEILRRTGLLCLYPDEKALAKDAMAWTLRRDHGLPVEQGPRADIPAPQPPLRPPYTT